MADDDGGQSGLTDKLLRHILYFAPAKEGASTAVLSRRWRSLWRTSGAINLDSRSYSKFARHHIEVALAAAEAPVRRLTLHVDQRIYENDMRHTRINSRKGDGDEPRHKDMAAVLLSSPAASSGAVEEIRFEIADDEFRSYHRRDDPYYGNPNRIELRFGDLPTGSLTTLHVANVATLTPPPPGAVFPRLAELQLRRCGVSSRADLRRIVGAAPQLATLHLLDCRYCIPRTPGQSSQSGTEDIGAVHCPAVTYLVFEACRSCPWMEVGLELDVPRLKSLRYRGRAHLDKQLPLKLSESTNPVRADLHFVRPDYADWQVGPSFWEFVQSFNVAKVLKLKLDIELGHVAVFDKDDDKLLSNGLLLNNLERLEVEVQCEPTTKTSSAMFIANLLRLCPGVRDLRLKLTNKASNINNPTGINPLSDFNKSIDHFRNHKRPKTVVSGDYGSLEVLDIPGLSDHSFECLRSSLRTVSLQFWMGEPNCFGVQLAKFFAENAVLLEEISIDDGNHKMRDHMNHMLRGWIRSSCKRKNSPSAIAFRETYSRKRVKSGNY